MKISVSLYCINCGNETIVCKTGLNEYDVYPCERCSQDDGKARIVKDHHDKMLGFIKTLANQLDDLSAQQLLEEIGELK